MAEDHSLNIVLTPVALTKTDSWNLWAGGTHHQQVGVWIAASAALDLVLVLALALLAQRLIDFVDSTGRRRWPIRALAVYLLAEWVEDILQFIGGIAVMRGEPGVAGGARLGGRGALDGQVPRDPLLHRGDHSQCRVSK